MKGKLLILFLLFTFKVDCQVYLGNIRDTNTSIKEILSYPELIITTDGKQKDTCLKILGFEAYIITYAKDTVCLREGRIQFPGERFTLVELERIQQMKKGETLYIPSYLQSCSSCVTRRRKINLKVVIL